MGTRNEPKTIEDIRRANKAIGKHWFSPDTMRFFRSQIEDRTFNAGWGRTLFISSEHGPSGPRGWSISIASKRGDVDRVTPIRAHSSYAEAHAWAVILSDLLRRRVDLDTVQDRYRAFAGERP